MSRLKAFLENFRSGALARVIDRGAGPTLIICSISSNILASLTVILVQGLGSGALAGVCVQRQAVALGVRRVLSLRLGQQRGRLGSVLVRVPVIHYALDLLVATHVDWLVRAQVSLQALRIVLRLADDRALRLLLLEFLLVTLEAV